MSQPQLNANLTPSQQAMVNLWEQHLQAEFVAHSPEQALATMTEDPCVIIVPTRIGGAGLEGLREYYARYFLSQLPDDLEMVPVSRTIGSDRLVDEILMKFTHSRQTDWILPGVAPTGKRVEVPVVAIVQFQDGKIANEHIYWDQASVLVQVGLIDAKNLPVVGTENVQKLL